MHNKLTNVSYAKKLSVALLAAAVVGESSAATVGLEEIVVTARKRAENLQDVPISVYAITGNSMQKSGIFDSLSVAELVPNLEIKTFGGQPNVFIRGVGNNDFNATTISPVSMYLDGVLLGLAGSQGMPLYDLQQMEVLRGPQGTLFGRNTTGGALVFHSRKPEDEFAASARLNIGNYDRIDGEAAVTVPIGEDTGLRLAAISTSNDGDRHNVTKGEDINGFDRRGARAILVTRPSDTLEITANIHMAQDRSDFRLGRQAPDGPDILGWEHPKSADKEDLYLDAPNRHYADQTGANLVFDWKGDVFSLKSITAYEDAETDFCADIDQSPNSLDHLCFETDGEQYSQEFNISFATESGSEFLLGAYFLHEEIEHVTQGLLFGDTPSALPLDALSHRDTDTYALFAEGTFYLTDRWKLNAGIRYTYEEKEADVQSTVNLHFLDPSFPDEPIAFLVPYEELADDWDDLSGRLALSYDLSDDTMLYASFSSGFKSGGFNLGSFFDPNEVTTVDPEYLYAYELGLKSTFWEQRGRFNVSGFYYDYSDLQVYTFAAGSSPASPIVFALENAADAEIFGLEAELNIVPTERLTLQMGLGLLRTEYKDFVSLVGGDLSGNKLPGAPELNANIAAEYRVPVMDDYALTLRGEYSYTDKRYFNAFEDEAISSRGSHQLVNARISFSDSEDSWQVSLWGRNLANEDYIVDATDLRGTFGFVPQYLGDLRSYGAEFIIHFN